jgi:hypothetical protein
MSRENAGEDDGRMVAAVALTELANSFRALREEVNMRVGEGGFDRRDSLPFCTRSLSGDHGRDGRAGD